MEYSQSYIKIQIVDSIPIITMEYEDIAIFKDLIFFLASPAGSDLALKTIEKNLLDNNKHEELEMIKGIYDYIKKDNSNIFKNDVEYIKPSCFK